MSLKQLAQGLTHGVQYVILFFTKFSINKVVEIMIHSY